jgi:hypothetical protein
MNILTDIGFFQGKCEERIQDGIQIQDRGYLFSILHPLSCISPLSYPEVVAQF